MWQMDAKIVLWDTGCTGVSASSSSDPAPHGNGGEQGWRNGVWGPGGQAGGLMPQAHQRWPIDFSGHLGDSLTPSGPESCTQLSFTS